VKDGETKIGESDRLSSKFLFVGNTTNDKMRMLFFSGNRTSSLEGCV
jgi:hypothetical protein